MSLKREADASFIKPDPNKRVKREGGDGNFSLSSIPMAPNHAATVSTTPSATAPKTEGGDRKPLAPPPSFGGNPGNSRKKKFVGNSIRVRRGDDWVSAHFNKRTMIVDLNVRCTLPKQWSSVQVEKEIFERLNNAKFDIQPTEKWGFLDRKFSTALPIEFPLPPGSILYDTYNVGVYDTDANKVKDSPSNLKKEEKVSQPKYERSE